MSAGLGPMVAASCRSEIKKEETFTKQSSLCLKNKTHIIMNDIFREACFKEMDLHSLYLM